MSTARKARVLDDGAEISDDDDKAPLEAEQPPAELEPAEDDAMVDELAETVDIRDLPPKDPAAQVKPPAAPAPSHKPKLSRTERREERREEREIRRRTTDPVLSPLARREDENLRDYLETITQGHPDIKISLKRERPEVHQGVKVNGLLDNYYRLIDEGEIKETWGGGKFALAIHRKTDRGDYKYLKHTTIEIAGDPKIEPLKIREAPQPTAPGESKTEQTVVGKLMDMVADGRRSNAPDMALMDRMLAPIRDQNARLERLLEAKDKELAEVRSRPTDPYKDRFVEKLIDQDSARIASIRTQHEAEVRTLKENARADLDRERDRAEREIARITAQHDREVNALRTSAERELAFVKETHAREIASLRLGYEGQLQMAKTSETVVKTVTEAEHKRLERENERLGKENAELRAKKDQSLGEKIKEITAVKDLINDDGDDEEKGWVGKLLESPLAGKLAEKLTGLGGGGGEAQPAGPQPGQIPPGVPFTLPDGRVAMRDAQGNLRIKRTAPAPTEAPGGELGVDPEQVKAAITFMEGAFRSGTDPKIFAASVRNMVPGSVLSLIAAHGVDEFFDKVAGLEATSPLAQQGGRVWARKVAKALVGTDD